MKQFIQYSGKHWKQKLRKCFVLSILCIVCCAAFTGCKRKEPEISILLNTEEESAKTETTVEAETSEETEEAESSKEEAENSADPQDIDPQAEVCVYICGCVMNPGVYHLPQGARICDAVEAAGGMTRDAAENYWNLAETLADGDMIYIPTREEAEEREEANGSAKSTSLNLAGESQSRKSSENSTSAAESSVDSQTGNSMVNINTADCEALMTLPGIGETRAAAIIAYRNEHGYFSAITDIKNVSGIGDALFENMKSMITAE